ncbi:hypothetical protein EBH_0076990 [Eimeria brunetti]|uniref:Uncharacterized protein n=1 Tax=Eimeria brunetti TaxID=51314 RepID=U6LJX0_9EIME|nr:hypothetical protein EBH_0076990 [Eimeria brunetti]
MPTHMLPLTTHRTLQILISTNPEDLSQNTRNKLNLSANGKTIHLDAGEAIAESRSLGILKTIENFQDAVCESARFVLLVPSAEARIPSRELQSD